MRATWITGTIIALAIAAPTAAHSQGAFTRGGRGADAELGGRPSFSEETGRKYDAMGELKLAIEKIKFTREQRDTLDKIETTYRGMFRVTGRAVRDLFSRGRPSMDDLDKLRADADAQRNAEWAEVRLVLTEVQLPTFEENLERIRTDEARRDAEMRARMPRGGRP